MLTNTRVIRVQWGDCDPAGIVFYPRYFEWFDACTILLFEKATGMTKIRMLEKYAGAAARLWGAASLGVELIRGVVTFFVTAPLRRDVAARWAAKSIHSRNQEEGRELLGMTAVFARQKSCGL